MVAEPEARVITSLEVHDFQSIAYAHIELGAWTSLVGESDVGKSAVIRALHAALTNRRGDDFIRHGVKACHVVLRLDDGTTVEWVKERGKSGMYRVNNDDDRVYEKTNGEVPEAVQDLLRVTIDVAGEPFTPGIQRQHDAPFMLADTARRRAQVLGEFDGTNITMKAEGLLRLDQKRAQNDVSAAEQDVRRLEGELAQYDGLGAAEAAYALAEAQSAVVDARRERHQVMTALYVAVATKRALVFRARAAVDALTVDSAEVLARIDAAMGRRQALAAYVAASERAHEAVRINEQTHDVTMPAGLEERVARIQRMRRHADALAGEGVNWRQYDRYRDEATAELHADHEALAALAGLPCPECGQIIEGVLA